MAEKPKDTAPSEGTVRMPNADPALGETRLPAGTPGADTGRVREAVGIFDSKDAFQAAVDDLSMAGFAPHELSLMAGDETVRSELGGSYHRVEDAAHDPDAPRQAIVSPEEVGDAQGMAIGVPAYLGAILATGAVIASGGTALAAALAAAAAGGAGGGMGAILANWVGNQRENLLSQHLDKGGLLLWVNLRDAGRERQAREIMARHTSHPVEVHEIPQA